MDSTHTQTPEGAASAGLTADFPPGDAQAWRAQVEAELKGASFEKALVTSLLEGIQLQPVYAGSGPGAPEGLAQQFPATRGAHDRLRTSTPGRWTPAARWRAPSAGHRGTSLAALVKEALEHGIEAVWFETPGELLALPAAALKSTTPIQVRVDTGIDAEAALKVLSHLTQRPSDANIAFSKLSLGLDPLSWLAQNAPSHAGFSVTQLADFAQVMRACDAHNRSSSSRRGAEGNPGAPVKAFMVSTEVYHNAGAHAVQELAYALASTVSLVRLMSTQGIRPAEVLEQMEWTFATGRDVFLEVSKLRAARLLWQKLLSAFGLSSTSGRLNASASAVATSASEASATQGPSEESATLSIHAVTSRRTLSRFDPWVNLLRTTTQAFAAMLGGADVITVSPFDEALGVPESLGRRIARNTHTILREESHLDAVLDPAGGSFFVESLTESLARAAWAHFQKIERQKREGLEAEAGDVSGPHAAASSGMVAALLNGMIRSEVAATAAQRATRLAKRQDALTGVSEFPLPSEQLLVREAASWSQYKRPSGEVAGRPDDPGDFPFPLRSDAAPFESLREKASTTLKPAALRLYVACLGPLAEHNARTTWVQNVLWAGGYELIQGLDEAPDDAEKRVAGHVEAFKASGAQNVCLSGMDERYATTGPSLAAALKQAGAQVVVVAGRPGAMEAAFREAGVSEFLYVGCDVLQSLNAMLSRGGL